MSFMFIRGLRESIATTAAMAAKLPVVIDKAVKDEANLYLKTVQQGFRQQGIGRKWHPISEVTRKLRRAAGFGGTKALIRSGDYRRSVNVHRAGAAEYFVGVHRTAAAKGGRSMADIAAIHERPFTFIPVTEKLRRFFMAMFLQGALDAPLRRGTSFLLIIGRAPLRQAFDKVSPGYDKRVLARINAYLTTGAKLKLEV